MAWIYSSEALPNPAMMGKPGYTPDQEFIRWGGAQLPPIPAKKWTRLPDSFSMLIHRDWRDKTGFEYDISVQKFKPIVTNGRFAERGVIWLDDPLPKDATLKELEAISERLNLKWRKQCIQMYEDQVREKEVTGHGRTRPTPYEDECFDMLNMKKPYSVDAMQAQRDPGAAAATMIAEAIRSALAREREPEGAKVAHEEKKVAAGK